MNNKISEYILGTSIVLLFLIHYFGFLDQGMMYSGIIILLVCSFIGLIWKEKVLDERDEFIRAKTDRYLFLLTLSIVSISILIKTFSHQDYFDELLLLTILSICKLMISKFLTSKH